MKEKEKSKDVDDKLVANRTDLGITARIIKEGKADRWTILHKGCSAAKLWLKARSHPDG
jgi:hypothetical protein